MIRLPDNTVCGEYTVHRFIKAGLYNDSYIVKNAAGVPFFLKFYDLANMPDKMLREGMVEEIVFCQIISHPNIIRHVGNGSGKILGVRIDGVSDGWGDGLRLVGYLPVVLCCCHDWQAHQHAYE
jgi:hypothetical protein